MALGPLDWTSLGECVWSLDTQAQGLCLRGEITSNYHHPHDLPSGTSNSNVRGIIHGSKPEEHNRLHFLLGRVQTHPSDTKWRLERDESRRWPQSLMKPAFSLDASSDVVCALVFALFIVFVSLR